MLEQLEQACGWTAKTVAGVGSADLTGPTPCAEWDLRTLLDHLVGGVEMFATAIGGSLPEDPSAPYLARYERASGTLLASLAEPGAMERMADLPIGAVPGSALAGIALLDIAVHGWDVAAATGQPTDLPEPVAAAALAGARQSVGPQMRGPGGFFAESVAIDDDAPAVDRLVALLGRDPRWVRR